MELKNLTPFRLFNRCLCRHSNFVFRGVRKTPPTEADPESAIVLFSAIDRRNVNAYLLAVKSFLRFTGPLHVVVQDDGTLLPDQTRLIRAHVRGVEIIDRASTDAYLADLLPADLRWLLEKNRPWSFFPPIRLLNPALRFAGKYLIQFDSDLLFLRRPDAVVDAIAGTPRRNFHSPGGNGLAETFSKMGYEFPFVSIRRFNAGFFGFQNTLTGDNLFGALRGVYERDADVYRHYEIENALWCVVLNLCGPSLCLKDVDTEYVGNGWAKYETLRGRAVMVHFVGSTRFRNLMYPRLARRVYRELRIARSEER